MFLWLLKALEIGLKLQKHTHNITCFLLIQKQHNFYNCLETNVGYSFNSNSNTKNKAFLWAFYRGSVLLQDPNQKSQKHYFFSGFLLVFFLGSVPFPDQTKTANRSGCPPSSCQRTRNPQKPVFFGVKKKIPMGTTGGWVYFSFCIP